MHIARLISAGLATGMAAAMTLGVPAYAAAPKATVVYSSSTFLPGHFSVHHGTIAVLACTTVTQVRANGAEGALPYPGCSIHVDGTGGIAYSRDGAAFAQTMTVHTMAPTNAVWTTVGVTHGGKQTPKVSVSDYEYAANPDGRTRYGTTSKNRCVTKGLGADAAYRGRLDTALPSVAAGPNSSWYVADRDGNTIYRLSKTGKLSVFAVLPAAKVTVSASLAAKADWPSCVVGTKVAFEAAPTEVEVGPDGTVYVAGQPTLKSGAEALDSIVYAIEPTTKKVKTLRQRYGGPVDLAIGTKRRVYVARPDADRISVIRHGRSSTYVKMAGVESVEVDEKGRLYAVRSAGTSPETNPAAVVSIR